MERAPASRELRDVNLCYALGRMVRLALRTGLGITPAQRDCAGILGHSRRDDIAFGDLRGADLAVDRRADLGIAEVDLSRLQLGLRGGNLRCQGAFLSQRAVDIRLLVGNRF